jgi:imidazolonepropionase-like amidohydrolase
MIEIDRNRVSVIAGGTLIDGTGAAPLQNSVIVIRKNQIVEIAATDSFTMPKEASCVFDASGKVILPGLIDAHIHVLHSGKYSEAQMLAEILPLKVLRAAFHAKNTLEGGFTSIRNLDAPLWIDVGLRDAVNEGLVQGPRMIVSGYKITSTGTDFPLYPPEVFIHGRETMDSPDEVRKAVRTLLAGGVDLIKVIASGRTFRKTSSPDALGLTLEEIKVAVWEAHNQGKKVAAHAHGSRGVKLALQAGCDSLEHGTVLDDDDIELMLKKGIFLVPTLSFGKHLEEMGTEANLPDYVIQKAMNSRRLRLQSFKKALTRGVRIALGSDSGMPFVNHGNNAFELAAMVDAGMTPSQAIVASTSSGAELLGISDQVGTISKGKLADLLIVDGNPLADISILQEKSKILAVLKEGQIIINRGLRTTSP